MSLSAFGDLRVSQFEPLTGWTFAYNVNPAIVSTSETGSGTVGHAGSFAVLQTGTDANGSASIQTLRSSRYITGQGGLARFTAVFSAPKSDSLQMIGLFDDLDGWGFGYNGLDFGIFRRNDGVTEWTYQGEWNANKFDKLDPTKGNVFEIKFQWLGFGMQTFSVENGSGELERCHVIEYANLNTDVSVQNPNLKITALVENTGNTSNIALFTPSAVAGIEGTSLNDAVSVTLADNVVNKTLGTGTLEPVLSLFNPTTWQGKNNRLFVQALRLTFATDGNKPVVFEVYAGGTVTGGAYTELNGNVSPIQTNSTFTSFSTVGAQKIGAFAIGKADNTQADLTGTNFLGFPGQTITIIANTGSSTDVSVGVSFKQFL